MDRSTPILLIKTIYTEDEFGVLQPKETSRQVFAEVQSVTASEWFEGGRNGLNPEFRFKMFKPDYAKEPIVEYEGVRYAIYRTYEVKKDDIELYAELRKGTE